MHQGKGRGGVDDAKVREVKRLLAMNETKKSIAKALGISRNTVHRIATGRHISDRSPIYVRCPKHGVLVKPPCVQCAVEEEHARPN